VLLGAYSILGLFLFLGLIVVGSAILAGLLLSPRTPRTDKQMQPYECGIKTTGPSHLRFRVGYYLFALLFLIFDIETLFLFPAAALFGKVSAGQIQGLSFPVLVFDLVTFFAILLGGLAYAWRKGALKWD
jgi:NADH:ubiquinone oxidoreductase subunit 3 (subunit A)